jgi:hypothetical protein
MRRLDLPEIEFGVSYARVCSIVFKRAGEMLVPFDVVAFRLVDEKCIFKVGEVLRYGDVVGLDSQGRGYGICKLCRVDETWVNGCFQKVQHVDKSESGSPCGRWRLAPPAPPRWRLSISPSFRHKNGVFKFLWGASP